MRFIKEIYVRLLEFHGRIR